MSVAALFIHTLLCALAGFWVLSRLFPKSGPGLGVSFLAGLGLEFMAVFLLCNLGLDFAWAGWLVLVALGLASFFSLKHPPFSLPRGAPSWSALALVLMAVGLAFWFSLHTPLIYDDALTAWAGRAKALYYGVNWSFDPASEQFLGRGMGTSSYPLGMVVFTAVTGLIAGGFDDFIARSGSLAGYAALFTIVWDCGQSITRRNWISLALVAAVWSLPFLFWQAVSGYADLLVGCFAAGSLCALVSGNFVLAGALGAGAGFIKNEGLLLFFPCLCLGCAVYAAGLGGTIREKLARVADFLIGAVIVLPWLAYYSQVAVHAADLDYPAMRVWTFWASLGVVLVVWAVASRLRGKIPSGALVPVLAVLVAVSGAGALACYLGMAGDIASGLGVGLHPLALGALWDVFVTGPVHVTFWVFMPAALVLSLFRLRDNISRTATAYALAMFCLFGFIFCFTGAYEYLVGQTTVHRVGAQMYGACVVCVGCWLGNEKARPKPGSE